MSCAYENSHGCAVITEDNGGKKHTDMIIPMALKKVMRP